MALRKVIFLTILIFCFNARAQDKKSDAVLAGLEKNMHDIKSVQADFMQEKKLAMFSQTLVINRFAWHVQTPMRYRMVMKNNSLKQWDEDANQVQEFSLLHNPAFSAAFTQMQEWFSGNYAALSKEYAVSVVNESPVILKFVPNPNTPQSQVVNSVTVTFRNDQRYLASIVIEEKNQDTTCIKFSNTRLDFPVDNFAWEVKPRA